MKWTVSIEINDDTGFEKDEIEAMVEMCLSMLIASASYKIMEVTPAPYGPQSPEEMKKPEEMTKPPAPPQTP